MMDRRTAVVAIGGNSLIKDQSTRTVRTSTSPPSETSRHIASMIEDGWDVAIGHGNGPQVGFILRRSELAAHELHEVPLDVCGADTQGAIGYELQQNLHNDFRRHGIDRHAVTVVTQVEVAATTRRSRTRPSRSARSWTRSRRPAPGRRLGRRRGRRPRLAPRRRLAAAAPDRRAVGHQGAARRRHRGHRRRRRRHPGRRRRVGRPARRRGRDRQGLRLRRSSPASSAPTCSSSPPPSRRSRSTSARRGRRWLDHLTLAEARHYLAEGTHFAAGSMGPKIEAVIWYLERGGREAIITDPENIERALARRDRDPDHPRLTARGSHSAARYSGCPMTARGGRAGLGTAGRGGTRRACGQASPQLWSRP